MAGDQEGRAQGGHRGQQGEQQVALERVACRPVDRAAGDPEGDRQRAVPDRLEPPHAPHAVAAVGAEDAVAAGERLLRPAHAHRWAGGDGARARDLAPVSEHDGGAARGQLVERHELAQARLRGHVPRILLGQQRGEQLGPVHGTRLGPLTVGAVTVERRERDQRDQGDGGECRGQHEARARGHSPQHSRGTVRHAGQAHANVCKTGRFGTQGAGKRTKSAQMRTQTITRAAPRVGWRPWTPPRPAPASPPRASPAWPPSARTGGPISSCSASPSSTTPCSRPSTPSPSGRRGCAAWPTSRPTRRWRCSSTTTTTPTGTRLWWARADGDARVLGDDDGRAALGRELLAARYPQYRETPPGGPVIAVDVARWSGWTASGR